MRMLKIYLTDFRNYSKKSLEFSPDMTLIIGPNGAGKTNIIEAVYLLGQGKSWRTDDVGEMVNFGAEVGHVTGKISEHSENSESRIPSGDQKTRKPDNPVIRRSESPMFRSSEYSEFSELRVTLTRGVVGGKRVATVKYQVDGIARRKSDFVGRLKVVLFEPESLEIVIGDPTNRRRFLDDALSQTDREYGRSLGIYGKALRTRNRLLSAIRDGKARVESLEFWERELVKHGGIIQDRRGRFIEWLDGQMAGISINYDASVMSEHRLEHYREREIAAGFTLVGPQRDDLKISCWKPVVSYLSRQEAKGEGKTPLFQPQRPNQQPITNNQQLLSAFGSRGEQRMAVFKLKLLEAEWIEKETGDLPVILLDDIFSELDAEHEEMVGKLVEGRQAIITATEIRRGYYPEAKIVELT